MTNITTAEQERRRLQAIAWTVAIVFHVLLLIALLTITPLREQILSVGAEQVEQAVERERAAAERHRERQAERAKQVVPEPLQENFEREIKERRRDELRQAVEELRETREQMDEQHREAIEELREFAVEQSPEDLEVLYAGIHQNVRRAHTDEDPKLKEAERQVRRQISDARKDAEALQENVRDDELRKAAGESAAEVAELAEQFAEKLRKDAKAAREEAAALAEEAERKPEEDATEEEKQEQAKKAERVERLRRRAKGNQGVAENIERRLKRLRELAEQTKQTAEEVAANAAPPEVANRAQSDTPADDETLDQQSVDELYDTAKKLEEDVDRRFRDIRAVELAQQQRSSFKHTRPHVEAIPQTKRPDLSEAIRNANVETLGEAEELRESLTAAVTQAQLMGASAQQQLAEVDPDRHAQLGQDIQSASARSQTQSANASSTSSRQGSASSTGGSGQQSDDNAQDSQDQADPEITGETVAARALPGRRFTDDASRSGWLYIDTWYIIGPWSRGEHARDPLPPEWGVNLDATYTNGKSGRTWHPRLKEHYELSGNLKWQFVQSESLYIRPPNETGEAIYYAYTEVYSDRERQILCAIDIDDWGTVWVNGEKIYSGYNRSWRMGEDVQPVTLKPGFNKILIRMENGAPLMDFSLLLLETD